MGLDFTALDNIALQTAKIDFLGAFDDEEGDSFKTSESHATGQNTGTPTHQLDKAVQEREQVRKMYSDYQENIHRAGTLRSDILKGMKRGEDPLALLLKAVECISLMTGDTVILSQARADILAVYGWGLGETAPLQDELKHAQERLERLTRANTPPGQEERLQGAIRAHREYIELLERSIQKDGA